MGNPIRRGKGKAVSVAKSPDSTNSSDISPKTAPKSKKSAKTAAATSMNNDVNITTPVNKGTAPTKAKKVVPRHLRFKSTATGTLQETGHFQPHNWGGHTKQPPVQVKALPATTPSISVQVKKTEKPVGVVTSASQKTSTKNVKKQGQTGVACTARHGKYASKPKAKPQSSVGVAKLQNLIKEFPPYNPAHHAKHLSDGSIMSQTGSSAVSTHTLITTPSPRATRERYIRVNEKSKDLLIHATGFIQNKVRCVEIMSANGDLHWQPLPGFNPSSLNFLAEMASKEEAAKDHFWTSNEVQIIVDLRSIFMGSVETNRDDKEDAKGKAKEVAVMESSTVIDQIAKLGKDFYKYVANVTVDIIFPPPREGSVAPNRPQNISNKQGKWVYPDFNIAIHTAGFKIIEQLVVKLDNCVGMQYLSVIIHNLNASTTCPFTLEQLYYALPFYDLRFEEWQLRWQGNYMSEPVDVGHFPIILLDKERNKWLWAKKKAIKDAEIAARKEQERIDKMVFVTKSVAPEWSAPTPALPEPFPKPEDTPLEKTGGGQESL